MSDILKFRIIGLCILAAFPLFGVGLVLLGSEWHWLGLLMCLSNSVAVIIIGLLMRPIIATTVPRSGDIYFIARIAEGFLLGISAMAVQGRFLGLTVSGDVFYQFGMIALGLGSLPMCLWLVRSKFIPTMLGALGFAGYLCLIAAMIAATSGAETASTALLLEGAAFEVMFGLILVLNGRGMWVQASVR
ncbi:MAG: hypothetical protein ACJASZ_000275 [Yoonia sp.]|jgi:hypothetical protein